MAHHIVSHHPYHHPSSHHHQAAPLSPTHLTLQQIAQLHLADPATSDLVNAALLSSPTAPPTSPTLTSTINSNNPENDHFQHVQAQFQHDQVRRQQQQHHQYLQHHLSSAAAPPIVTVSVNDLGQLVGLSSLGLSSAVDVHRDWSRPLSDGHLMLHPFSDPTLLLQSSSASSAPSGPSPSSSFATAVPLSSIMLSRELESFLPSHHVAPIFLSAFFESVAPWIPAFADASTSPVPVNLLHRVYARPDLANLGLLYAVMCLGAHALERSRNITVQNEARPLSRLYFERARHILSPALTGQSHSIVTVQAFLLLAYYALNLPGTAASTLCQLAMQMIADMGLDRASFPFKQLTDIANHNAYDKEHGDQLLATLYSLHVSLALVRGQPIHVPTPPAFASLCQMDGANDTTPVSTNDYAIWSLRLANLANSAIRGHFFFSDDMRTQLAAFRDRLPAHLRFQRPAQAGDQPTNPMLFAQSALLNLRYYSLVLLLAQHSRPGSTGGAAGISASGNLDTMTRTVAAMSHILQAIRDHLAHFPFPLVHECAVVLSACSRLAHLASTPSPATALSESSGSPAPPTSAIVGDDAESSPAAAAARDVVDVTAHLDAVVDLVYASMALWPEMATLAFTVHGLERAHAKQMRLAAAAGHARREGMVSEEEDDDDDDDQSDVDDADGGLLRDPWRVISAFNESSERVMEAVEMLQPQQQKDLVAKVLEKYLPAT